MEDKSAFVKKVKDKGFWRASGCSKKDLNKFIKPIQDCKVSYQEKQYDREIEKTVIKKKWEKLPIDYIRRSKASKK